MAGRVTGGNGDFLFQWFFQGLLSNGVEGNGGL